MPQAIEHAPLADLPSGDPPRAIEGYVRRFLQYEDGPNPAARLALGAFCGKRHAPADVVDVAGDLVRAHLAPAFGTLLTVYAEGESIVYRRPTVLALAA